MHVPPQKPQYLAVRHNATLEHVRAMLDTTDMFLYKSHLLASNFRGVHLITTGEWRTIKD